MGHSIREARLKPQYSHLYPPIVAGVWTPAVEVGARMLFWQGSTGGGGLGDRPLDSRHFEFRGGWSRGDAVPLRTRAGDVDAVHPNHPRQARG